MPALSFWEKDSFLAQQDVIIAGSGFTGLWSAFHLKTAHPALKVTILERGFLPTGASSRNAGFSCFGSPSELLADLATMGENALYTLVEDRFRGLEMIRDLFAADETGYEACGGYEVYAANTASGPNCVAAIPMLNEFLAPITGCNQTFTHATAQLDSLGCNGFDVMIANPLEGALHPGKLLQCLLARVQGIGVQVFTGITVDAFTEQLHEVVIQTNVGEWRAAQLLLCTNAFTPALLPGADITPNRGQVLLTAPLPRLALRGTFHFDEGFYYFRNVGDRLLIGGARNSFFAAEQTTSLETTDNLQQTLEDFVSCHLLPGQPFEVTDRWAGIMAMGQQKSPLAGAISAKVFGCVRMSGMGVALAPGISRKVSRMMRP